MSRRILLVEDVARDLISWSARRAPQETGGILLGALGDDNPWVMCAVEVRPLRPAPSAYEIPKGITSDLVLAARQEDTRLGYLGDWHSHPADIGASWRDRATYRGAVSFARWHSDTRPIMLVVRRGPDGWTLEVTDASSFRLFTRVVQPILTGRPPSSA
jgi:proteasome lid subunit RPN8/RPN11